LGSDTGGSIRLPAAYCNVYGFKPSYGMISRYGLVSYASSLDTVGIFAGEFPDLVSCFDALAKYDSNDPNSLLPQYRRVETPSISNRPLRIGVPNVRYMLQTDDHFIGILPEGDA
jgi:aspartyl-tRNA(Asn)/glutamyl-tRNA(Gln) amidotransferase subunit A